MSTNDGQEWFDYYERFDYFTHDSVRDGCHPWIFRHATPSDKAIVLVHGLTDSPYFVTAIARHFHAQLGYDVFLPLLHCHGLKEPMCDLPSRRRPIMLRVYPSAACPPGGL